MKKRRPNGLEIVIWAALACASAAFFADRAGMAGGFLVAVLLIAWLDDIL